MSHLKYSAADLLNLARVFLQRTGHETKLLDYQVTFLDLGAFKIG